MNPGFALMRFRKHQVCIKCIQMSFGPNISGPLNVELAVRIYRRLRPRLENTSETNTLLIGWKGKLYSFIPRLFL